jgi:hypothetical protein
MRADALVYAGAVIALCYVTRMPQPFRFARLVWRGLCGAGLTAGDIGESDAGFREALARPERFAIENAAGETIELVPGGARMAVREDQREEFRRLAVKARIREMAEPLAALRRGFTRFFPQQASALLAPWELELLICGPFDMPIADMRKHIGVSGEHAEMLWRVLEGFTPEERRQFVKFGCGRSGLPPPGRSWTSKLQVKFTGTSRKELLPTAGVCGSVITIPLYKDEKTLEEKLRKAITFSGTFENDGLGDVEQVRRFT